MYLKLSKKINQLAPKYLDFLIDACNIESNSFDKQGIDSLSRFIVEHESQYQYNTSFEMFERAGNCICMDLINNSNAPFVVLSAHMDTVFERGAFGHPPAKCDGEFIYGPGACDCKGGIAVALLTMAALKECEFDGLNVRLLLQSDEEVSSSLSNKETVKYICNMARGCKAFLNLEPKYPGYITLERGGIINTKFTVIGKSAHSSKKGNGVNAINEAVLKIAEIIKQESDTVSFNCGQLEGGNATNVIPDRCVFSIEARTSSKKDFEKVKKILTKIAEKQFVEGTHTTFEVLSERIPMELTDLNVALFDMINGISEKYGFGSLQKRKSLGGSDASYTTDARIPTADGLGIVGYNLHSTKEMAEIRSLAESAKLLAAIILEFAQGDKNE